MNNHIETHTRHPLSLKNRTRHLRHMYEIGPTQNNMINTTENKLIRKC